MCERIEIWHTIYNHLLEDTTASSNGSRVRDYGRFSVRWADGKEGVPARYTARIAAAYPLQADGKVLLRFPRFFVVAIK